MAVYLTSYATARFESVRQELNDSAQRYGIKPLSYSEQYLNCSAYYQQNRGILDERCGAGYWAWKPYFVLQALERIEENDILFYCDAGSKFISSPAPLVQLCRTNSPGLMLFD